MKNKNIKFQLVEVGRGPSGLVAIDIVVSGAIIGDGTHRWLSIKINSFDINNDAIHIAQADHCHQLICFFSHSIGISEHQPNINVPKLIWSNFWKVPVLKKTLQCQWQQTRPRRAGNVSFVYLSTAAAASAAGRFLLKFVWMLSIQIGILTKNQGQEMSLLFICLWW